MIYDFRPALGALSILHSHSRGGPAPLSGLARRPAAFIRLRARARVSQRASESKRRAGRQPRESVCVHSALAGGAPVLPCSVGRSSCHSNEQNTHAKPTLDKGTSLVCRALDKHVAHRVQQLLACWLAGWLACWLFGAAATAGTRQRLSAAPERNLRCEFLRAASL